MNNRKPSTGKKLSGYFKLIILVAVCSLFVSACMYGKDRGEGYRSNMMTRYLSHKLDLNDEQKEKLSAISNEIKAIREESSSQREADKAGIIALIQAEQLDTVKLQQLMDQKLNSIQKNSPRILPLIAELHATLDAEQKEELVEMMSRGSKK
jgi:Spy/CpxP family protein refolding chaperone